MPASGDLKGNHVAASDSVKERCAVCDESLYNLDGAGEGASKKRQELIVVASLLDKAPNLAGLSRTCEVYPTTHPFQQNTATLAPRPCSP